MFLKLKDGYCLRGWKNRPYALSNKITSAAPISLTSEQMKKLSQPFVYPESDIFISDLYKMGCFEECSSSDILNEEQKYLCYPNHYFDNVIFSITGRCNYNCRHCSVAGYDIRNNELSFTQIEQMISEFKSCGLKNIVLIGGEPLVHPDFLEICEKIISEGLFVKSIYTNASLVDDRFLDKLEGIGIAPSFSISYDGYGFHDKMRGISGAEKNVFRALSCLKERGLAVNCYMSITAESVECLEKTVNVLAEYNVNSLTVFPPLNCGRWADVPDSEKVSLNRLIDSYIEYIPRYIAMDFPITLNLYKIAFFSSIKKKYILMPKSELHGKDPQVMLACRTFGHELNISPSGFLSPCYALMDSSFVKENMPNVLNGGLKEAISNSSFTRCIELKAADILDRNIKCRSCRYSDKCGGGCRAEALLSCGGFDRYDPTLCYTFENGYYEKLLNAVRTGYEIRRERLAERSI